MGNGAPTRDSLHHEAFSEVRVARSFFENYLPGELARRCDWSTLANKTPVYKKCFDGDAFCDLLFEVGLASDGRGTSAPLLINLLFEHQSRPDRHMPLRILRYMVRIWERFLTDNPRARHLPAVYPVVLHQSRRQWRAPVHLRQLFAWPPADVPCEWLPDFQFQLIDLAAMPFSELRAAILANGLLAVMKAIEEPDCAIVLDPVIEVLQLALGGDNDAQLLSRFLGYLFHYSRNLDMPQFMMKIESLTHPDMKTTGLSLAEQFIEQGREQGREQGLELGREALVSTLERLATRRFGALPPAIRARLHAASIPELERLADRLLDVGSLAELFPEAD